MQGLEGHPLRCSRRGSGTGCDGPDDG
jgi:hypothetical protein